MEIKRNFLFAIFFLIFSTQLSAQCLTKSLKLDPECKCNQKKSCLNMLGKSYKKMVQAHSKNLGKKYATKLHKLNKEPLVLLNKAFAGETLDPKKIEEIKKKNKQIAKINKKLELKTDAIFTKKYGKTYNSNKIKERLEAKIYKGLHKSVRAQIKKNGLSIAPLMKLVSGKNISMSMSKSDFKKNIPKLKKEKKKQTSREIIETKKKVSEMKNGFLQNYKINKSKMNSFMKKKYKTNDLIASNVNLFKAISNRYTSIIKRLDQKTINKAILVDNLKLYDYVKHAAKKLAK